MTVPVSNDSSTKVDARQSPQLERGKADGGSPAKPLSRQENSTGASDDTLSLSPAARQISSEKPVTGGEIKTPDEALNVAAKLKEKLAANPGFATAVHDASDISRLATRLDGYA